MNLIFQPGQDLSQVQQHYIALLVQQVYLLVLAQKQRTEFQQHSALRIGFPLLQSHVLVKL